MEQTQHNFDDGPWAVKPGAFGQGKENIHVIENFIDSDDVKKIIGFARNIKEWHNDQLENTYNEEGVCTYDASYWNDRQCTATILKRLDSGIYDLIDHYIAKMAKTMEDIFHVKLTSRPPCLIRWFGGIEQQPHADKQLNDGSPNPFPTYDINSLFYYNDDFEGGELYYPQHDIIVKPKPGLAVLHPGDFYYMHGVKPVISGERYTTPAFYTVVDE